MDTFLLKLTQFEKTGSIRKNFIPLENLITREFPFSKSEVDHVFRDLYTFAFRVNLPFNNGNVLNIKKNHKSNGEKSKRACTIFRTFSCNKKPKKNQQDLYKSTHHVHHS